MTRPVALITLGFLLACAGAAPTPWQGNAAFTAELQGSGPTAAVDGPRLVDRLVEAGVGAELTVDAPDRLTLAVTGARDDGLLREVVPRGVLQIGPAGEGLSNEHLAEATVQTDTFDGRPVVAITLTEAGAQRFCALTRARVDQVVEIVVDGVVLSAPVVREAICGGSLQISLGSSADPDALLSEATGLAGALRSGALESTWTLTTVR